MVINTHFALLIYDKRSSKRKRVTKKLSPNPRNNEIITTPKYNVENNSTSKRANPLRDEIDCSSIVNMVKARIRLKST